MKDLNLYIVEKLRINKNTDIEYNKLLDDIYEIYHPVSNIFDKYSDRIIKSVKDWCKDNNVTNYKLYSSDDFKIVFKENHGINFIDNDDLDEMLENDKLSSTKNPDVKYIHRYKLNLDDDEYLDTAGNYYGFVISGWETFKNKSTYGACLLIEAND